MPSLSTKAKNDLQAIFSDNEIRFDKRERLAYSIDIGAMPKLVKPIVSSGLPSAVVRPKTEQQVIELMRISRENGVELVPRAWSTSGYGGVLPPKNSVVVDLSGMNKVLSVDPDAMTVTVQASAIWEVIDRDLKKHNTTLRLYPSSYPSSSAAGWLAQGGSGFGSFEFGTIKENVVSAKVVLPTGEVKLFEGNELLTYIADAEGITGIITELTVRIRPLEEECHRLLSFSSAKDISSALASIHQEKLPIWSITFLNPESTRLKKQLPHRHGHDWELQHQHIQPAIPESFLAVLAYPKSKTSEIEPALDRITEDNNGTTLPDDAAEHEWEQRFSPMRLKRIGPSIIPTEVIVPLDQLQAVLQEIDEKIGQPFVLEGMVSNDGRVVLLGFIPHDERAFTFNLAFALSLSVIKIAKAHGGSGFSTGLYFKGEAASILGEKKVQELTAFKRSVDPQELLNPGKVIGSSLLGTVMTLAQSLESLIRPIANRALPPQKSDDVSREKNGIPGDVALMSYACARCGYCIHTCDQFEGRGWESHSPRGKYTYIREIVEGRESWDRESVDTMLLCTTCEVCNDRCQLQIPIEHNWMTMRGKLIQEEKRGTFPPFEMMSASLNDELNIWAGKAEHRADWVPEDLKDKLQDKGSILYFPGCTASFVEKDIAEATARLLTDAGYDLTYMGTDEACCGIPMKMAGKWDQFEEIYEHNTEQARKRGAKTIVTSCPACALVWKELYANTAAKREESYEFEVKHYSELLAPAIAEGKLKLSESNGSVLTFHDSCHLGRAQGIFEEPRQMLGAIPGAEIVEMEHNREEGYCCGSVLTLIGEIDVAPKLGNLRLQEAVEAGAETVVAACPCCQVQLRDSVEKNNLNLKVDDLARVVAQAAGYDIPESTEYSLYMWSYFEKFIILMQPEQMAKLMSQVFPQMLDAMPAGMKPMMLSMKKVPGGLDLMERMMPALFPKLAPGILDKVMPDIIEAVGTHVGPMPDDMQELMPDLLPKTMKALLPTYIPELVPYLAPAFIDYIRNDA